MHVIILGVGVVGVTSAYDLARAGHQVTVLERQPGSGLETSFANAGQDSPGYSAPWAAPGIPVKALKWLMMRHRPLVLWPRLEPRPLRVAHAQARELHRGGLPAEQRPHGAARRVQPRRAPAGGGHRVLSAGSLGGHPEGTPSRRAQSRPSRSLTVADRYPRSRHGIAAAGSCVSRANAPGCTQGSNLRSDWHVVCRSAREERRMRQSHARSGWADLLDLTIEINSERPLFQQIYLGIRDAIVSRRLVANTRLPSTRGMAQRLNVSRTSVLSAYEQLLAEGYVSGRKGSGTYVSDVLPALMTPDVSIGRGSDAPRPRRQMLSDAGQRYERFAATAAAPSDVPFATGCCSVDSISIETWRLTARRTGLPDPGALAYTDPIGEPALRQQIAEYLGAARAVNCDADQIVVLSGAQQAIDISIRTLIDPGDAVWVEDPGYLATREALVAAGCRIVPVPVDEQGLDVRAGIAAAPSARAVYITPSHQYPTGSVMSMQRRMELLAWASESGAWVIEDDYDGEFRYVGRPLASLQGLDRGACVIYVGTFSKVLFPGLRLGFAVLPHELVDAFRGARFLIDRHPPFFQQAMIAAFMKEGFFSSHLRRLRQHYRASRDVLVEAIWRHMGDLVDVEVPECGIQLMVHLHGQVSDVAVASAARRRGVTVRAVSPLYIDAHPRQGLLLGYSGFDAHRMRTAAIELAGALREVRAGGPDPRPSPKGADPDGGTRAIGASRLTPTSRAEHAAPRPR